MKNRNHPQRTAPLLLVTLMLTSAPALGAAQQETPLGSEIERAERLDRAHRPHRARPARAHERGTYMYRLDANHSCARLGIAFEPGDQPVIREVMAGSAAGDAGLRAGDRLLMVDDREATARRLEELSAGLEAGERIRLTVERDGRERTIDVEARPAMCSYRRTITHDPMIAHCAHIDSTHAEAAAECHAFGMRELRGLARYRMDSAWADSLSERLSQAAEQMPRVFHFAAADSGMWMRFSVDSVAFDSLFFDLDSMRVLTEQAMLSLDSLDLDLSGVLAHADSLRRLLPFRGRAPDAPMRAHALMLRNLGIGMNAIAGARLAELNPDLADYFEVESGVLVTEVAPDSPADRAGVQAGDVVVGAADEPVRTIAELRRAIARTEEPPVLDIIRKGRRLELRLQH